ncbi:ABC transporter permease [Georgenia phoenicis]|uniref:ABC transporter permease n=1 Tax=unclassified Georgenia TaxID=2626815 RepID=UPI0039B00A60
MNPTTSAVRAGARRGWIEFRNSLRAPEDLTYYLVGTTIFLVVMWFNRDNEVEGTGISLALLLLPGVLAFTTMFSASYGLASAVAAEREDGTLLRAKSVPHGMRGYVTGQTVRSSLEVAFNVVVLTVPATVVVPRLWSATDAGDVLLLAAALVLGLAACLPIGFAVGSVFRSPRAVGGWGMLVMAALVFVSGVFVPASQLPGWAQLLGQLTPMYWMGHLMRQAVLPEGVVVIEIGETWRTVEAFGVLGLWALVGILLAPVLLRRMARRESGSVVAAGREKQLQRV